jgi:CheY-like chemotaxis protein
MNSLRGSQGRRSFEAIIRASERAGKMVKSLLSFARQSPAEAHKLDLNEILREEIGLLERTTLSNVTLEMDLASDLQPILGDASALTHAFMNLCVNAVDAMPESGTLTLRTRNVDDDWIEVMVKDTGTGMNREVLERAMDPFFTTKEVGRGTGLGLSMVYSTVKAHRGQLEIQSEPGRGTRVVLRFPAHGSLPVVPASPAEPRPASSTQALKVLLVDDDELIQSSVLAILEALGHDATGVPCGEQALARLEAGFLPDVVILDMNMPGLGGAGTLPRLRILNPIVPVLLATGRVDQSASDLARKYPFVTLLSKPFSMRELRDRLDLLGRA